MHLGKQRNEVEKHMPYAKVLWNHKKVAEATSELENEMQKKYLILFAACN